MAFPQIVQSAGQKLGSFSLPASFSVSLPAGVVDGNLLFIAIHVDETSPASVAAPAGWTALLSDSDNDPCIFTFYKVAATEPGTVDFTATGASAQPGYAFVLEVSGAGSARIEANTFRDYSTTISPPSITASWGSADNLFLAILQNANAANYTGVYPAGYTSVIRDVLANDGAGWAEITKRELASATDDPANVSGGGGDSRGTTIVIGPTAGPSVTVTQAELTPGDTISGTYADYATVPTTLTVSDGTNTITIASPTITDNGDGTGTFSGTMPALPTSGTANLILFGDVTVELI